MCQKQVLHSTTSRTLILWIMGHREKVSLTNRQKQSIRELTEKVSKLEAELTNTKKEKDEERRSLVELVRGEGEDAKKELSKTF